jgi:hypothetical protein
VAVAVELGDLVRDAPRRPPPARALGAVAAIDDDHADVVVVGALRHDVPPAG